MEVPYRRVIVNMAEVHNTRRIRRTMEKTSKKKNKGKEKSRGNRGEKNIKRDSPARREGDTKSRRKHKAQVRGLAGESNNTREMVRKKRLSFRTGLGERNNSNARAEAAERKKKRGVEGIPGRVAVGVDITVVAEHFVKFKKKQRGINTLILGQRRILGGRKNRERVGRWTWYYPTGKDRTLGNKELRHAAQPIHGNRGSVGHHAV